MQNNQMLTLIYKGREEQQPIEGERINRFMRTDIIGVVIPAGIKKIGDAAFSCCMKLKDVSISSTVETIGRSAFAANNSLQKIEIPENVQTLEWGAFADCKLLKEVQLNEGLKDIEDYVFVGCSNLTEISIPSTVKFIGFRAFFNSGLKKVNMSKKTLLESEPFPKGTEIIYFD